MKYIIKYYRKEKGVWKYDVKLTTDFDLLINYLKIIERCSQYKLYAVTTFKCYEEYALLLTSEDSKFKMMCYGNRGTHIKV